LHISIKVCAMLVLLVGETLRGLPYTRDSLQSGRTHRHAPTGKFLSCRLYIFSCCYVLLAYKPKNLYLPYTFCV